MSSTAPTTSRSSIAPAALEGRSPAALSVAASTPPFPITRRGIRTIPLRGGRWRVTREAGEVLGYVDLLEADSGREPRWRASRMPARHAALRTLGEFPSADDALDVIRLG